MISSKEEIFDELTKQFQELQSNLDCYLNPPDDLHSGLISSSKTLYDLMKSHENDAPLNRSYVPKQLLTRGFDSEQVWQQLQLYNTSHLKYSRNAFKDLNIGNVHLGHVKSSKPKQNLKVEESVSEKRVKFKELENDLLSDDEEDEEIDLGEDGEEFEQTINKTYKPSIVDDNFFKLRQMEEFLIEQDKLEELKRDGKESKENDDSDNEDLEEEIDFFGSDDDYDAGSQQMMYQDFFDPPSEDATQTKKKNLKFNNIKEDNGEEDDTDEDENLEDEEADDSEEEEDDIEMEETANETNSKKTAFERKQEELKQKISKLEEANISKKPWQLIGEATAKTRPVNSLLEEHVTFDHTSAGAPVITEETTETIEDIIKQRIRDQAWDDVERKVKPAIQPHEYKKAPELNMEKSKLSLAEVYEKEYLKQVEDDKEEKENEEHVAITRLMDKLFVKLDALSNFYFTPKPNKPDIKIITNTPSIQMEEVTPITMSKTSQMAPEEIFEKKKGDVVGATEKTDEDRKRERRQKKIKKKFAVKEREAKEALKAKTTGKSSKKKAVEQLKKGVRNTIINEKESASNKAMKSSSQFFSKLQDEVTKNISSHKSKQSDGQRKSKKQRTENFKL